MIEASDPLNTDIDLIPNFWRRHFHSIRWYGRWTYGFAFDQTGVSLHVGPWSFWIVL